VARGGSGAKAPPLAARPVHLLTEAREKKGVGNDTESVLDQQYCFVDHLHHYLVLLVGIGEVDTSLFCYSERGGRWEGGREGGRENEGEEASARKRIRQNLDGKHCNRSNMGDRSNLNDLTCLWIHLYVYVSGCVYE